MNKTYDFIVIGAGISACTFASVLNNRFPDASILLVEHGRRIGGRATTRKSRKNKILEFDHGLPSISFSKFISQDLLTLIAPLINSKKLVDISNDILIINEFGEMKYSSNNYKTYRSLPFMINFCEEIINQSINPKKISFLFKTLTKSFKRKNNWWEVQLNNKTFIKSKHLILSSSLIAHPRCLKILQINSLPLRDAFINGEDEVVDRLLREISKQNYLSRKIYIFHVPNWAVARKFNKQYLQINFSQSIKDNLSFERIIFQGQSDGSIIITLHCYYISNIIDIETDNILKFLISIFVNYQIFLDLFVQSRLIDIMDWRASQPLNNLLSKDLQWSSVNNIGFCGDWFDLSSFGGLETAMNSSIRLAKLINWN